MKPQPRIVDNRVFLLGLDELYREAMKAQERTVLLRCARETADALSVGPAEVPIEGYYSEDEQLTEYFRLVRALQTVPKDREGEVATLNGFVRLKHVTESPIFGPTFEGGFLLSGGEDALAVALKQTYPDWNIETLTHAAYHCALDSEDFSLVALAALSRDSVVLAALRESVVLYAIALGGSASFEEPEYVWEVDEVIETRARRFVETFNDLFDESLPLPGHASAEAFWRACKPWKIVGRCVRIGFDDSQQPIKHYHWAIDHDDQPKLIVKDFWDTELWTTERYQQEMDSSM